MTKPFRLGQSYDETKAITGSNFTELRRAWVRINLEPSQRLTDVIGSVEEIVKSFRRIIPEELREYVDGRDINLTIKSPQPWQTMIEAWWLPDIRKAWLVDAFGELKYMTFPKNPLSPGFVFGVYTASPPRMYTLGGDIDPEDFVDAKTKFVRSVGWDPINRAAILA